MTFSYVNTGTSDNKGDGDSLRTAFTKINSNFAQLTSVSTGTSQVVVGLFPPENPEEGAIWWNTNNGLSYVYYKDLNSNQWVSFTHIGNTTGAMLNFPANPTTGTNYVTGGGVTYIYNGVAWDAVPLGMQGIQGIQGLQGLQGTQGLQGIQGIQGIQGDQGLQGTQGITGDQGLQGIQGVQGTQGIQGTQGLQGDQGIQGTQGLQGDQGIQGTQGLQGDQGIQGIQGIQGVQGIQGIQGLQGDQGIQGIQGIQGFDGTQGFQGIQGTQGIQGIQGFDGIQGFQGVQGVTADQQLDTLSHVTFASVTTPFIKLNANFVEKFDTITSATGVVVHNCANGSLFNHVNIVNTFTVNVTNLDLNSGYATNIVLILNQGAIAYVPTDVQILGNPRPIFWQGGVPPLGGALKRDIVSFSILNNAGTYTVYGQLVSFG